MKNKIFVLLASGLTFMLTAGSAYAQDGTVYVPVDIFACEYKEGKGPSDLDAAVETWNAYMDKNDSDSYAAWTLTKHYASPDQEFDFLWLGANRNGTTMGEGTDEYYANGGDVAAEFASVADCPMAGNYASRMFKAPASGNVPENGVLSFSNCTVKDDANYQDVIAAVDAWSKVLGDAGSTGAMYHWYPVFGTGENDIDYKAITSYPSFTEFGKDYDRMGNGGLFMKQQELLGDLVECDVDRVYAAQKRRDGRIRE